MAGEEMRVADLEGKRLADFADHVQTHVEVCAAP